ncbi:hypothetical protein [Psychrobacter sp. GP33]|uniref:hypothetical protein n=1 Tax=Psychrobacter sp. GP33 TaxID=2758709 RepID=UPI0015F9C31C|nr:hypothetical protein [Psychrobacter sp. GP33]
MNFEDYYRLRQAEEEVFKRKNVAIKIEYPESLDEYRQIDDIILDFHNEFYVFKNYLDKFYTLILFIVMLFLVFSFIVFSFLTLSIVSFDFLKYFFDMSFEKEYVIKLWFFSIGANFILLLLFFPFLFFRDKAYESSYYQNLVKTDSSNNEFTSEGLSKFRSFTIKDYRTYWVKCLFDLKDIEYVFTIYNNYISHKDELDQVVSIKEFLSNKFTKGIFAVFTTGVIGFLASYNANIQSENSDLFSKNPQFFFDAIFMIFYSLLSIFLTYFLFFILKDWFFNFVDLFRNNSEVTEVRKNRLVYYIHQSRVLKIKGRYGKLSNNSKKITFKI